MIDIEYAISWWIRWKDRLDELEVNRACGVRPHGIEYRIMLEGGVAPPKEKSTPIPADMIMDTDLAWRRIHQWYPQHMEAVKIFHLRKKSFRAVRMHLGVSQHMSRKLVSEGERMLQGGLAAIAGFQE